MPEVPHALYIIFAFALGSCVGSFLNVVVWRLPRVEHQADEGLLRSFLRSWRALAYPPSHCPKCEKPLKWYDNLPVIGWIKLGGRCRFCKEPISPRYPIVEATMGLLFVLYYVMFFMAGFGPCLPWLLPGGALQYQPANLDITQHWPIYLLDMMLISALVAASLIDAELFIIPPEIPWFVVPFAIVVHAVWDRTGWPGALNLSPLGAALAAGAGVGLVISFILYYLGIIPASFAEGGPLLEVEKKALEAQGQQPEVEFTPAQIRREMRKEMLFLLPPLILGFAWLLITWKVPAVGRSWATVSQVGWVGGLLGSFLGLMVGGFVVWIVRILGSYAFGREAMGMGDVDLMAAVGAVLGPGAVTVAFFISPFCGIVHALYRWLAGKGREVPYGPYLSVATAITMLFYCPIANYLSPGLTNFMEVISQWLGWS